ncbi:branched-subunit amino acid transport system permease [Phaeovulum vinaykumarii]|uniref:Fructose transport system permease protein n=1 Tax=Phaeovulum vinaykumarii TaxID=407234 RepID=A0A1N7K1I8_9RHOB|nr:fructose transport system permease protein [Phaeovulum vinaykumarii]SOB92363.1 branched-subunit amino acid transport system permease [Phaeovulum vinaykumarii]
MTTQNSHGPPGDAQARAAPAPQIARFAPERSLAARLHRLLHQTPAMVPLIVLVSALAVFAALLGQKFLSPFTLTLILQQVAIVGIVGAAQTLVILTAGIDLSVGAVMVLSSVVMGQVTFRYGMPPVLGVGAGLATGALMGLISGLLVARMKLPPFIVTLGMWQIVLATNFLYSANETIRAQDIARAAPLLQVFGQSFRPGGAVFTHGVVAMVALVLGLAYVLRHTAWGRHVYAVSMPWATTPTPPSWPACRSPAFWSRSTSSRG